MDESDVWVQFFIECLTELPDNDLLEAVKEAGCDSQEIAAEGRELFEEVLQQFRTQGAV